MSREVIYALFHMSRQVIYALFYMSREVCLRASSGILLRVNSCCLESFGYLCLWRGVNQMLTIADEGGLKTPEIGWHNLWTAPNKQRTNILWYWHWPIPTKMTLEGKAECEGGRPQISTWLPLIIQLPYTAGKLPCHKFSISMIARLDEEKHTK